MPDFGRYLLDEPASKASQKELEQTTVEKLFDEICASSTPRINIPPLTQKFKEMASNYDNIFASVDSNRDQSLSLAEINSAIDVKSLSSHEIHQVMGMRRCLDQMAAMHPDGGKSKIHKADVATYVKAVQDMVLLGKYDQTIVQIAEASSPVRDRNGKTLPLFADSQHPENSIVPEACAQIEAGGGNCILISSMSSLARVDKQSIKQMITDNGNDTFTVVFPGFPESPVTVTAPSEDEVDLDIARKYGTWSFVLQKAFGRFRDPTSAEDLAGGREAAPSGLGLRVFQKGALAYGDTLSWSSYSTQSKHLLDAINRRTPIMATTPGGPQSLTPNFRLPGHHAYAVLDFQPDSKKPELGVVTLMNPWRHLNNSNVQDLGGGKFRMTLDELNKDFDGIVFGEKVPMRRTIYHNWYGITNNEVRVCEPVVLFSTGMLVGMAAHAKPKLGAATLLPLASYEMYQDSKCFLNADNSADKLKYGLGASADAVMLAGIGSRLFTKKAYGLYAAYGGLVARYGIENWL